jgi:hypothetical protein
VRSPGETGPPGLVTLVTLLTLEPRSSGTGLPATTSLSDSFRFFLFFFFFVSAMTGLGPDKDGVFFFFLVFFLVFVFSPEPESVLFAECSAPPVGSFWSGESEWRLFFSESDRFRRILRGSDPFRFLVSAWPRITSEHTP